MERKTHAISSDIRMAVCGVMYPRYYTLKRGSDHITCQKCRKRLGLSIKSEQLTFFK